MSDYEKFKKFFENNLIKNNIIDKSSSYFKNGKWNSSRCRINPCFWPEAIAEYLTFKNFSKIDDICEYFLNKTREISKNNKLYNNSHSMDLNAIKKWFNIIDRLNEKKIKEVNKFNFDDVKAVISDYISEFLKIQKITNKLSKSWIEYEINEKIIDNFCFKKSPAEFSNEMGEKIQKNITNKNWNIFTSLTEINLFSKSNFYKNNYNLINIPNVIKEIIGRHGEEIAFYFLKDKFGEKNVNWISLKNPYNEYDFEITFENKKFFVEVKTSKEKMMNNFFISKNEYNFYLKNKDNYFIIFVWNIYENRKSNSPTILFIRNPKIFITFNELNSGISIQENKFIIYPFSYIGNFSKL